MIHSLYDSFSLTGIFSLHDSLNVKFYLHMTSSPDSYIFTWNFSLCIINIKIIIFQTYSKYLYDLFILTWFLYTFNPPVIYLSYLYFRLSFSYMIYHIHIHITSCVTSSLTGVLDLWESCLKECLSSWESRNKSKGQSDRLVTEGEAENRRVKTR